MANASAVVPVSIRRGTLLALLLAWAGVGQAQPEALFGGEEETVGAAALPEPQDDRRLRSRVVKMDLARIERARAAASEERAALRVEAPKAVLRKMERRAGATLNLNLFDDATFTAVVDRTARTFSGGYSVSGHLAGDPYGHVTLVVNGETVAGTVHSRGRTFEISSAGEGHYRVTEVELPPFECEVLRLPGASDEPR